MGPPLYVLFWQLACFSLRQFSIAVKGLALGPVCLTWDLAPPPVSCVIWGKLFFFYVYVIIWLCYVVVVADRIFY